MTRLTSQILLLWRHRLVRRNIRILGQFLLILAVMVVVYSLLFHYIMLAEGREHSFLTGFYWTLTVMSTLGFGDITFNSDLGRMFSLVVLLSGIALLLVLLPFTFIQFFYAPWMEAQAKARAPRELPASTQGHVILIHYGPMAAALISRLRQYQYDYVLIVPNLDEALQLHDMGLQVMLGDLDNPETYRLARAPQAAMVVTMAPDVVSTNVAFTVREVAPEVPIIATVLDSTSKTVLELAGCNHVLQIGELMGETLARRTIGGDAVTHVIGEVKDLCIAEANATRTPLVGKTLRENQLANLGVSVVGVWERGRFEIAGPDTVIGPSTVLVLAGSRQQLQAYDEEFVIYNVSDAPVILIGAGRVGRATARALEARGIDYRVIDRQPRPQIPPEKFILGNAADEEVLKQAGIEEAPAVLITTHDDDVNIYLTLLLRHMRPQMQIICRSTLERNVSTMHRAGADFVLSSSMMAANMIMNLLKRANVLMVAEGLNIVSMPVPPSLAGKKLAQTSIREETGCRIIAVVEHGKMRVNPDPHLPLPADAQILIIGTVEAEEKFLEKYAKGAKGAVG